MLHKTGNKYKTQDGVISILSTFGKGEESYCLLIAIGDSDNQDYKGHNGNRYCEPVKVENPYNVSPEEMSKIANNQPYEIYTDPVTI